MNVLMDCFYSNILSKMDFIKKKILWRRIQDCEDLSANIIWSDNNDVVLPSYGVKRKLEKNNFLLLGAMRILLGITKDDWGTKVKRTLSKRAGFILKTLYYLQ